MRDLDIHLQNYRLLPGENLEGVVTVRTNGSYKCNRVVLKVKGKEHTEFGSGENRVTDDRVILGKVYRISEGCELPEGTTRIPISIPLPLKLPPTYRGHHGYIEYTLEAVVEVDWAIDPKCKRQFRIIQSKPPIIEAPDSLEPPTLQDDELQIELEENIIRLDKGIKIRFKVRERSRVRGVRFEIVRREVARCHSRELKHDSVVVRKFYPVSYDDFDRWMETDIGKNWKYDLPLASYLFEVTYYLKVTLDVGLDFDPSIRCPVKFSDILPERDVLEEIASDLGIDDW